MSGRGRCVREARARTPRTREARARGLWSFAMLVLLAAALLLAPAAALAKSYSVTDVEITSRIEADGTLVVQEWRTFDFSGDFTFVYWELEEADSQGIEIVGAGGPDGAMTPTDRPEDRPPGTYFVSDQGSTTRVDLFFDLSDTSARFGIEYRALGAAKRWDDTGELYWQLVGDGWEVGADRVRATVASPPGVTGDEVRAWAHGPLWGTVGIEQDGVVVLEVDDLPAQTFVEVRMLFPRSAVPAAPRADGPRVDAVLAEEGRLADEANAERAAARWKRRAAIALGAVLPLVALGVVLFLFFKYGREYRTQFQGPYFRELPDPDLAPALVGSLMRWGTVKNDDAVATLLDLANRGIITISPVDEEKDGLFGSKTKRTYSLTLERMKAGDLRPLEQKLVHFLFDDAIGADSFTIEELRETAKEKPKSFHAGWEGWRSHVASTASGMGFVEKQGSFAMGGAILIGILSAVGGFVLAMWGETAIPFIGIPAGVVILVMSPFMRRRTPRAGELHAKYKALKKYLEDFGRLDEKPPDAVVLWEHFLVLAVVFGIADKVMENMKVKVPEIVQDPGFTTMTFMAASMHGGGSPLSELSSGFSGSRRGQRAELRRPAAGAASPVEAEEAAAAEAAAPADVPAALRRFPLFSRGLPAQGPREGLPRKRVVITPRLRKAGDVRREPPWHVTSRRDSQRSSSASRSPSASPAARTAVTSTSAARSSPAFASCSPRSAARRSPCRSGATPRTSPSSAATAPFPRRPRCSPSTATRRTT